MLNRFYFRFAYVWGLVAAVIVTAVILGNSLSGAGLPSLLQAAPVVLAIILQVALAWALDRRQDSKTLPATVLSSFAVFVIGSVVGCLLNFTFWYFASPVGQVEFFDYFFKPLYWLVIVGVPAAAVVGVSYFYFAKKVMK